MSIESWAAALESSGFGEWMRSSALAYPIANLIHLLGLALLFSPIVMLDLRLLGLGRKFALPETSRLMTRWAIAGLLLLICAGVPMFVADASPLAAHPLMRAKLLLIALGIANAIVFRLCWQRRLASWDYAAPLTGRLQAIGSIVIWLCVAGLGRWIAYA